MRVLTRVAAAVVAVFVGAAAALAQDAAAPSRFAPAGEGFAVEMPGQPSSSPERVEVESLAVAGRRYEAADESGRRLVVWSLKTRGGRSAADSGGEPSQKESHLDLIAEVAWRLLVMPEFERAKSEGRAEFPQLAYVNEFRLDGRPAREYALVSKKTHGPVFVCADGPRVYVVAALGASPPDPRLKQFVRSFTLNPDASARQAADPRPGTGMGTGGGGGTAGGPDGQSTASGPVDYNRTFRQGEVVKKAVITFKPEPVFTEQARRFSVSGVIRLRAVLNKTGEVTNVSVIKGLPHGLTWSAVAAAKGIKFQPAQKDGRAVSQYVTLDYNFNIY